MDNETQEYVAIEPIIFENNGKTFKYDSDKLTIEQVILATEVAEFRRNQMQAPAGTFQELLRSGGVDWLMLIASYLLREIDGKGELKDFNRDKAEIDVLNFVKNLPRAEFEKLEACINDFFSLYGKPTLSSNYWQKEQKQDGTAMLLPLMMKMIMSSKDATNL